MDGRKLRFGMVWGGGIEVEGAGAGGAAADAFALIIDVSEYPDSRREKLGGCSNRRQVIA